MGKLTLKPCPFCGDDMSSFAGMVDGAFATNSKGGFAVSCDCGVIGPTRQYMVDAVVAWNERERRTAQGVTPETPNWPFRVGDRVRKHSGAWWEGRVVGYYSTAQTPIGYCVQMETSVGNGPVQIYPLSALSAAPSLSTSAGGEERG